nr:cell division protein FtsA [Lachnospiraceae bacterium]
MPDKIFNKKNIVFGLDIGTRSIVGSVGYLENNNKFNVIATYSKEHETRAMLDGQIHDIAKVSDTISKVKRELEAQLSMPLKDVCIAAAGRVLKTITVHVDYELNQETPVNSEQIY